MRVIKEHVTLNLTTIINFTDVEILPIPKWIDVSDTLIVYLFSVPIEPDPTLHLILQGHRQKKFLRNNTEYGN